MKTEEKINTDYSRKPGPTSAYDWVAFRGTHEPGDLIGFGRTEQEAIDNLISQESDLEE